MDTEPRSFSTYSYIACSYKYCIGSLNGLGVQDHPISKCVFDIQAVTCSSPTSSKGALHIPIAPPCLHLSLPAKLAHKTCLSACTARIHRLDSQYPRSHRPNQAGPVQHGTIFHFCAHSMCCSADLDVVCMRSAGQICRIVFYCFGHVRLVGRSWSLRAMLARIEILLCLPCLNICHVLPWSIIIACFTYSR